MLRIASAHALVAAFLAAVPAAYAQTPGPCLYETEARTYGTVGFVRYISPDTFVYNRRPQPVAGNVLKRCHENESIAVFIPSGQLLADYANLPGGGFATLNSSYQSETEIVFTVYERNGERRSTFGTDGQLRVGSGRVAAYGSNGLRTILPQPEGGFVLTGLPQGLRRLSERGDSLALTPADSLTYLCPIPATDGARPAARVLPHDSGRFGRGDARFLVICGSTLRRFLAPGVPDESFGSGGAVVLGEGWALPRLYHAPLRRYYGQAKDGPLPPPSSEPLLLNKIYSLDESGVPAADFGEDGMTTLPDSLTYLNPTDTGTTAERGRLYPYQLEVLDDGSLLLTTVSSASRGCVGICVTLLRVTPAGTLDIAFAEAYGPRRVVEPGFTLGSGAYRDIFLVLPGGRVVTTDYYQCTRNSLDWCYRTHILSGLPTATSSEAGPGVPGAVLTLSLAGPHPVRTGTLARFDVAGVTPGSRLDAVVVDALGRAVPSGAVEVEANAVTVETDGLAPGVYGLRVRSGSSVANRAFVVVR